MRSGVEVIYQGALIAPPWHGYSDFLIKVDGVVSNLGNFSYDVADTKLARSAKPKHIIQLCVYADLLAAVQGVDPPHLHVVLGNGEIETIPTAAVRHYYATARDRFLSFVGSELQATSAEPCSHCTFCRWAPRCEAHWEAIDHLSRVASIARSHIAKLEASGIRTLESLATSAEKTQVPDLNPQQFHKLRSQAALQLAKRTSGENQLEILPLDPPRGFDRLPQPSPGDMFFDMEGDPHQDGGLEYLFGVVTLENGRPEFAPFWGHDRSAEKLAFEACVDFMRHRLKAFPLAHIYHFGTYEETALKRLAMVHGTRENEVDDLLRRGKLVDLYRAVREAVRVSEPRYSIKNLEAFYRSGKREGEVTTAGASIVMYERWRRTQDAQLLADIETYNRDDCVSTWECRDWLLGLRPEGITMGERNAGYVKSKSDIIRVHLTPFFGDTALEDITAGKVQEYRAHRQSSRLDAKTGKPKKPARATLHHEIVTLRQILKTANRKGWIPAIPDMSAPYKTSGKVEHRAWFSPEEYKMLYEATRERAKNPPKPRWREVCETFHDYVLFMGNTGLRPDEASRLELRDVKIVKDESTGERILEIEVRGKRGVGFCKSMPGAILPFERVSKRKGLKPTDRIFGKSPRELMNTVLDELNLKFDRDGHIRTCYSLRHTYICMRLLEGADIYQVAKNCRTSVEMIEKYYGRHLTNTIDASAVNVRKARPTADAARKKATKSMK